MKPILLFALALFSSSTIHATMDLEECFMKGWATTHLGRRLHFSLRVNYDPDNHGYDISAIRLILGRASVIFPQKAFDDFTGRPVGVYGCPLGDNEFILHFSGGDGSRCFTMDFLIRDGRLVERHLIPAEPSELHDKLRTFDASGRVVYDGPCDRQGKPTRAASKNSFR